MWRDIFFQMPKTTIRWKEDVHCDNQFKGYKHDVKIPPIHVFKSSKNTQSGLLFSLCVCVGLGGIN